MTARAVTKRKRASPRSVEAVRLRIAELGELFHNHETGLAGWAILAAKEDRPAYWRVTDYSNAAVGTLVYWANSASLAEGLRLTVDPLHPGKWAESLLAALIPLNKRAERELKRAKDKAYWDEAPGARRAA